ncbi:hypothetical protein DYB37_007860 [Aphanomyces astaci]|uniref:UBC core domain-containing protein n=3 Tax=Aphanomyces astaci TaxID=112090 RepID=A0A3R6XZX4_APHAT|nr:hypothetical protein AaE_004695 [Aphanomyces astaci]RHY94553.1 hypothetical protein DYB35_010513 [Aphanomyces astaci]RHZ28404.1 hypothetical protein DYB37_007860 [Aphanomyces astaci]
MASSMATKRLRKEYMALRKNPEANIEAIPLESNILEWHYVIRGIGVYEGGYYHGKLKFPAEYPMKPPAVYMLTTNGRFQVNKRLCLSMSDYHPETWNPMWSVSSILAGLFSFMNENTPTLGSIVTPDAEKRKLAALSLDENCRNATFVTCFPDLVALHDELERTKLERGDQPADTTATSSDMKRELGVMILDNVSTVTGAVVVIAIFGAMLLFQL